MKKDKQVLNQEYGVTVVPEIDHNKYISQWIAEATREVIEYNMYKKDIILREMNKWDNIRIDAEEKLYELEMQYSALEENYE